MSVFNYIACDLDAKQLTLLVATHDLDFVYQWADWVLGMEQGELIAEGETLRVFEQIQLMPDFQLGMPTLVTNKTF